MRSGRQVGPRTSSARGGRFPPKLEGRTRKARFFSVVTKGAAGEALKDSARLSRLLVEGISRTLSVALARDSSPIEGERTRILHRLRLADHDQETPASPSMGEAPAKRAEGV